MDDLLTDDFDCYDDEDLPADELSDVERLWWAGSARERQGECVEALILYTQGFNALSDDEGRYSGWAEVMLSGRRRMKHALGIKLDSLESRAELGAVETTNIYFDMLDHLREPRISRGQVHVWSRSELIGAHKNWPVRISLDSIVDYYTKVEHRLRRLNEEVRVMHRTFAFFLDRLIEAQPLLEQPEQSFTSIKWPRDNAVGVAWPPGRNQPCWCESEVKYKKCCGAAAMPSEVDLAWGPTWLRHGAELAVCRV